MGGRKFTSPEQKRAVAEHARWLAERGIKPPRGQLKGVPHLPAPEPCRLPPLSNSLAYHSSQNCRDQMDPSYRAAVEAKSATVEQSFNKGPLQPQTNTDFTKSRRRD